MEIEFDINKGVSQNRQKTSKAEIDVQEDVEDGFLDDKDWIESRIRYNQSLLQDYKHQKERKKDEGELDDGRRRWFNREIQKTEEKVSKLHERLKEVQA